MNSRLIPAVVSSVAGRVTLAAMVAMVAIGFGASHQATAHSKIIQPPSMDEPVVSGPISKAWAQAHCNAASPEVLGSDHVVGFAPYASLPCPAVANPGGQVNPQGL